MSDYDIGDTVRIRGAFTNASDVAADPTAVTLVVKDPAGTSTTYVYLLDAALIKDTVGSYHLDMSITLHGIYRYRWNGTGAVSSSQESSFTVRRRRT